MDISTDHGEELNICSHVGEVFDVDFLREVIICQDGIHSDHKAEKHPRNAADSAFSSAGKMPIHLCAEKWGPRQEGF